MVKTFIENSSYLNYHITGQNIFINQITYCIMSLPDEKHIFPKFLVFLKNYQTVFNENSLNR